MTAKTYSVDLNGVDANLIGMQCKITPGSTGFKISGLPVSATLAIVDRIRSALTSMGLSLPAKTISVTIPPNGQSTDIAHLDLPIAMSLLTAMDIIPIDEAERQVCIGGLSEYGMLVPVSGALPAAIAAAKKNFGLVCSNECRAEAAWVGSVQVIAPKSLIELVNHFNGRRVLSSAELDNQQSKDQYLQHLETVGGRSFLTVCNTRCLYLDGLIYPIFASDHAAL